MNAKTMMCGLNIRKGNATTMRIGFGIVIFSLLAVASAFAAPRTWGGGNLDWTNTSASGWNGTVPGGSDTATINAGTVTVTTVITSANTPSTITLTGGMLVMSTGKLVSGSWTQGKTFTIGSGATLRLNNWGYDVAGSLGALDYGRDRLVVNGGIIEVTGNSSGSGRNFTVGTGGATFRASMNSGQTCTLYRDSNPLYHDIQVNSGRTLTLDGTGKGIIENTIINSTGTGNITKAGTGTWILSGTNTYSGSTIVNDGTLLINSPGSLHASSAVMVNGGTLGGNGTVKGSVTNGASGSIAPGALGVSSFGTLSIGGSLNVSAMANGGTGKLKFDLDAPPPAVNNDKIVVTGTLTIGSGALGLSDFLFTESAGFGVGTYTLITSGGITPGDTLHTTDCKAVINGLLHTLKINGNSIELTVTRPGTVVSFF